jgi:hypothetical protein
LNGRNDIGPGRQVENALDAFARTNYRCNLGNIGLDNFKTLVFGVPIQVFTSADDETVEHAHLPTVSQQAVYEMTPNEATSPRNQIPHELTPSRCAAKSTQS